MDQASSNELIRQAQRMVQELCHRPSDKKEFVLVVWRFEFCRESVRTRKFSFRPRRSRWRQETASAHSGFYGRPKGVVPTRQGDHQYGP